MYTRVHLEQRRRLASENALKVKSKEEFKRKLPIYINTRTRSVIDSI